MEMDNLPNTIADSPIQMTPPKPNLVPIGPLVLPRVVPMAAKVPPSQPRKETPPRFSGGIGAIQILTSLCVVGVLVGVIIISKK